MTTKLLRAAGGRAGPGWPTWGGNLPARLRGSQEGNRIILKEPFHRTIIAWLGIFPCLSQSVLLSGLNLGLFPLGKLELEIEAKKGDSRAKRVLHIRDEASFALATISWGNVAVNSATCA